MRARVSFVSREPHAAHVRELLGGRRLQTRRLPCRFALVGAGARTVLAGPAYERASGSSSTSISRSPAQFVAWTVELNGP